NCDVQSAGTFSPAGTAELCLPSQVAADSAGNIFFVDRNRIRKGSPDGTVTSIAGDGTIGTGTGGDGGPATQPPAYPNSVGGDSHGNVYFAEWARVRRISTDDTIITVAGTGNRPNNNGCSAPSPVCAPGYSSSDGSLATLVQLFGPLSVTVDTAGNLYFVDGL